MELKNLLHGVSIRAPWQSAGRPILMAAGFDIRRGYDLTISSALADKKDIPRQKKLEQLLTEHLVAGEKLVRFVKLKPGERAQLETWVNGKRRTKNDLTDAFPGVASAANIRVFHSQGTQSLGSIELDVGVAAMFTTSRSYLQRVEIPTTLLKAGAANGFEKIIGLQRLFVQTYDAIWIPPKGNLACISTDFPKGAPQEFGNASQISLEVLLRRELGRTITFVNLWPAVGGLYKSRDGGRLVDYGFTTDNESVKHHKARRGAGCLREDIYDQAGAGAVGDDLSPFKVALSWTRIGHSPREKLRSSPELLLPGIAAMLHKPNPVLDHAVLRDGLTSGDLNFVTSKLIPHI